ncbi:cell division protein FtsQ/DivIB [Ilumatobacter sp.]|uniref:cell division protein FtsQ/DivIB n=1 Tax=Ilumatobacter sp. TaxID=1967498 RepID=UPI003B52AF43
MIAPPEEQRFSDVKLVKRPDNTRDVLAELSAAFGDDDEPVARAAASAATADTAATERDEADGPADRDDPPETASTDHPAPAAGAAPGGADGAARGVVDDATRGVPLDATGPGPAAAKGAAGDADATGAADVTGTGDATGAADVTGAADAVAVGDATGAAGAVAVGREPDGSSAPTAPPERSGAVTTIAIGGDDGLPDARYLDEELDPDDGSDTVFIDDDGIGDAVLPKDATGPGIEPRLRQRRIGVRRAEGRRRLLWTTAVVVVVAAVVATLAVLGSSWFAVDDIELSGFESADRDAVESVVADLLGTPVLLVDTDDAERRLEAIAWVESARVRTDFPRSASVELRERTPVATVRGVDGRFRILDVEGRVLDVIDGQPVAFVLIAAPPVDDLEPGDFVGVGHAAAAALSTKLTPAIRSRLVSMSTTPDGSDLRLVLSNDPGPRIEARLGAAVGDNDQLERLVRLQLLLDDVIGTDTTVIDVATGEATVR